MQQFFHFLLEHWMLSVAFIVVLFLIIIEEKRGRGEKGLSLAPQEVVNGINRSNATIIDIRAQDQFKEGHIVNSLNIPAEQLTAQHPKLQSLKSKPLVLVCNSGLSVRPIATKLKAAGFANIKILQGGIAAWTKAGLPLVKK